MAKFQKGQSGNPNGRPIGVKNKNYLDPQDWAALIWKGAEEAGLEGKELIDLGFRGLNLLFTKIPALPGTATESVENVEKLIDAFEREKAAKVNASTQL